MLRALWLYSRYMLGQFAGSGEALNVSAIRFACEAESIPRARWGEVTEESMLIHQIIMERAKAAPAEPKRGR